LRAFERYTARTVKGTKIDNRYVLGDLLGSGGMARVFLTHDEALGRAVALKILWEQYADNEEFVERFKREARSAAALSHPNVVSVYDWGCSEDETYYIAMEYVPGGTLKDRIIGEGALDPSRAAELGCQVAEALGFAHKRGVIHRDVKPQNILLTASSEAKVADFGIARAVGAMAATSVSKTGMVLGTVAYMSPEQALGEPVGPQSDLYSLGVVLYEMLTGNLPHEADSPIALAVKHVSEPVRPPKEVNPEVPDGMNALVSGLLAKKAEDRHGSAVEIAEDLRRVRHGLLPLGLVSAGAVKGVPLRSSAQATRPISLAAAASEGKRWTKRTKAPWVLLAAFALFALLGGGAWSLLNGSQGQDLAPNQEDSQAFAPVSDSEDEATEASEEAEQVLSVGVAPANEPTQGSAQSTAVTEGTGLGQAPPPNAAVGSSSFTPAPVNNAASFASQPTLQPAPAHQEAQVQVGSDQQAQAQEAQAQEAQAQEAQAQVVSSQFSYDGESEANRVSSAQKGQATEQVFESSKSSDK
jgi:serine/threonine-protein kinase